MDIEIAKIKKLKSGMFNGGWCYDSHPYLASLDAGKVIEIANIKGPAVIKSIFTTKHEVSGLDEERTISMARGIVLLIYYNDEKEPAVEVPLADFFCDGCNSKTGHFSNIFIEHTPEAYMAFFPIPFEKSCRVCLRNDTPFDTGNYSFVEYEKLEKWDDSLGYFHSTYTRIPFQSTPKTIQKIFELNGCSGHIIGQQLSISTDEPVFGGFFWLMEANNEIRIDTNKPTHSGPYKAGEGPDYDYLGTECAFGLAWGFKEFIGQRVGCAYCKTVDTEPLINGILSGKHKKGPGVIDSENTLSQLSVYRFYSPDTIRFEKSIDWRLNWTREFTYHERGNEYRKKLDSMTKEDRLYVDYAYVMYWYQNRIGFKHTSLPPFKERCLEVLHSNKK